MKSFNLEPIGENKALIYVEGLTKNVTYIGMPDGTQYEAPAGFDSRNPDAAVMEHIRQMHEAEAGSQES